MSEASPSYLSAGGGGAAYPASTVATWPAHNRERFTVHLFDRATLDAAVAAAVAAERERPTFTPAMIEAIYAAWHGAGVDIAGGNWKCFVGMLPLPPAP